MSNENLPIFVYGTLRNPNGNDPQGNYSWALAGRTQSETTATLDNAVMHSNGGFPFVRQGAEFDGTVIGEVMVPQPDLYDDVLRDLDRLEGYSPGRSGNLYERTVVTVTTADGEKVQAYTYQPNAQSYEGRIRTLPVVESGDWVGYKSRQPVGSGRWY